MPENADILVILPNWVGDVVMATPALKALRQGRPQSRIVYTGRPTALAILDGTEDADEMIPAPLHKCGLFARLKYIRRLRRLHSQTAILFPNSFRAALTARLAGASRRIGYDRDGRGRLLTDKLTPLKDAKGDFLPEPMLDYYARLLRPLGLTVSSRQMHLPIRPADHEAADAMMAELRPTGPCVMLNPGASFGATKLWPVDRYAELAKRLIREDGATIIINAAPNDTERLLADAVATALPLDGVLNLARRKNSLGLVKALLSQCDLLVTNDTGARHIAAAMGAGLVTIFGSTDPEWARIDYSRERILRKPVDCSPCQSKVCRLADTPDEIKCLHAVSVDEVYDACQQVLSDHLAPLSAGRPPEWVTAYLWENHLTDIDGAFAFQDGDDLHKPGLGRRRRTRLEIPGPTGQAATIYLKRYDAGGKGRPEGEVEFQNVRAVLRAGVPTMQALAGESDKDGRSFIVVTGVPGDALERTAAEFIARRGSEGVNMLSDALAELAKKFHQAGFVHRDFYAAHIFLEETPDGEIALRLIDLARVFSPCRLRRFRWRVKDLAQLKFSMPEAWAADGWSRFMDRYLGPAGKCRRCWEKAIDQKVASMKRREARRARR